MILSKRPGRSIAGSIISFKMKEKCIFQIQYPIAIMKFKPGLLDAAIRNTPFLLSKPSISVSI
jgi:hypothetical protein